MRQEHCSLFTYQCVYHENHNGEIYSELLSRQSCKVCVMPIAVIVIIGISAHYLLFLIALIYRS